MHPVIPRVKVGDILKGTRNLRNWLQAADLYRCIRRGGLRRGQTSLYIPSKDDDFIVAANSWESFAAWSPNRDIMLFFCNPRDKGGQPQGEIRLNPTNFATWFVHTSGRHPDLKSWPDYAYYMWAVTHMNLCGNPEFSWNIFFSTHYKFPFDYHYNYGEGSREGLGRGEIAFCLGHTITRGYTREKGMRDRKLPASGFGPLLTEIDTMRQDTARRAKRPGAENLFSKELKVPKHIYKALMDRYS